MGSLIVIGAVAAILSFLVTASTPGTTNDVKEANAQTPTTPQQQRQEQSPIITEIQKECETAGFPFPLECVSIEYESPQIVVLNGEVLLTISIGVDVGETNPYIWKAVDRFKAQGYTIDSILMGGQGSKSNPNEYHIVMSR